MNERQIENAFTKYDINKNGVLEKTEARPFIEEVFNFRSDWTQRMTD